MLLASCFFAIISSWTNELPDGLEMATYQTTLQSVNAGQCLQTYLPVPARYDQRRLINGNLPFPSFFSLSFLFVLLFWSGLLYPGQGIYIPGAFGLKEDKPPFLICLLISFFFLRAYMQVNRLHPGSSSVVELHFSFQIQETGARFIWYG